MEKMTGWEDTWKWLTRLVVGWFITSLLVGMWACPEKVDTNKRRIEHTEQDRSEIMAEKKHRIYTEEFKLEALGLLKSNGKSAVQIERDLGITAGLLTQWRDRYQVANSAEGGTAVQNEDTSGFFQRVQEEAKVAGAVPFQHPYRTKFKQVIPAVDHIMDQYSIKKLELMSMGSQI